MKLGIFNKVFERDTIEANLDAVRDHGLTSIQLNLETLGGEPMPAHVPDEVCTRVRSALVERGIELAALSGTWNIIHPTEGPAGIERLRVLTEACPKLGTELITMCTGTRDPDYLWRAHPDNDTPEAWRDAVAAMARAVEVAESAGVTLVFEPEVNNVVNTASKARRLLDEIASPHLRVVIDGANLFHAGQLPRMREVLDEAFDLLGDDIRMAHAKDLVTDGDAGHQAAGTGVLDYGHYLALLDRIGFDGSVILHSLEEDRVPTSVAHVRERMPVAKRTVVESRREAVTHTTGEGADMAGTLDPQVEAFMQQIDDPDAPAPETLPVPELRALIGGLMIEFGGTPDPVASVESRQIPGPAGPIPTRVYTPEGAGPFPVLVFYHGGGWVLGDLDTAETLCQSLAHRAGCVAVSVDYRLAPEHPYPAAADDAYAALEWVAANAAQIGGDGSRIAVAGDSAGGNLSAVVALMAAAKGGPTLRHQCLLYPVTDLTSVDTASHREFEDGYLLTRSAVQFYIETYVPDASQRAQAFASPLHAGDLAGLPPAYVLTAGFDPLRDEGEAYALRLQESGVAVKYRCYEGMIHGFLSLRGAIDRASDAYDEAAGELRSALAS